MDREREVGLMARLGGRGVPGESTTAADSGWQLVSQAQLLERGIPPVEWEFEGFLDAGSPPTLLFGAPGELKSWIALHLAWCAATGEPAFGRFRTRTRPGAIYVNLDAAARAFERRAALLPRAERLMITNPESYNLEEYRALLERNAGAFVVADCLSDMYTPDPRGEQGAEMRGFVRPLRALYERTGCGGLIIDHANRGGEIYGSVQKAAGFRSVIQVERVRRDDLPTTRKRARLTCIKASETEPFAPFLVELAWEGGFTATYIAPSDKRPSAPGNAAQRHAEALRPHLSTDSAKALRVGELHELTGLSEEQVRAGLKALDASPSGAGSGRRYHLRLAPASGNGELAR